MTMGAMQQLTTGIVSATAARDPLQMTIYFDHLAAEGIVPAEGWNLRCRLDRPRCLGGRPGCRRL